MLRANRLCQACSVTTRTFEPVRRVGAGIEILDEQLAAGDMGDRPAQQAGEAPRLQRLVGGAPVDLVLQLGVGDEELVLGRAAGEPAGGGDQGAVGAEPGLVAAQRLVDQRAAAAGCARRGRGRSRASAPSPSPRSITSHSLGIPPTQNDDRADSRHAFGNGSGRLRRPRSGSARLTSRTSSTWRFRRVNLSRTTAGPSPRPAAGRSRRDPRRSGPVAAGARQQAVGVELDRVGVVVVHVRDDVGLLLGQVADLGRGRAARRRRRPSGCGRSRRRDAPARP